VADVLKVDGSSKAVPCTFFQYAGDGSSISFEDYQQMQHEEAAAKTQGSSQYLIDIEVPVNKRPFPNSVR